VLEEYQQAAEQHHQHEIAIRALADKARQRDQLATRKAEIEEQITQLHAELVSITEAHDDLDDYITVTEPGLREAETALPHLPTLKFKLDNIELHNQACRQAAAYYAAENDLADAQKAHAETELAIQQLDQRKADALASAPMPVPGLSLGDDGLTLNGIPLKQACASEQLRVSVAVAMALNPKLRVITIRDGSLLDSVSKALLQQTATEQGYQVWLEAVDESGNVGVVIEDGMVALDEPEVPHTGEVSGDA
jgi:hypothetical protein